MTRASKMGHNVLFVDPPINTGRLFFRQFKKKEWSLKRLLTMQYVDDVVRVYTPLIFLPFYKLLAKFHANRINNIAKKHFDKNKKTIIWIYHVEIDGLEEYLSGIKHDFLIYDCVDNYAAFPKYDTKEKKAAVIKQEQFLTSKADIVFASAPGLMDKLKRFNEKVFYTPNVGDYELYSTAQDYKNNLPADLAAIPSPRIGFIGAVDEYKFDRALLREIAKNYPNYSFVIIGPMALKDREASVEELGFAGLSNVYFLGSRPYKETPKYMSGFDVFIIPFVLNDYTVGGCFPIKFHDALAAGLPVVVTDMPAYKPFEDYCYISRSYSEFSQNVRRAYEENSPEKTRARLIVAKENSWEHKVKSLFDHIDSNI
jgi:glycosyltransferase involved in cell wall biosynthesis